VLITGGGDLTSFTITNTAELYDPAMGTFSSTVSLNMARVLHTATLLNNGMVLIAGGDDGAVAIAGAELYNPDTRTFASTSSLNIARENHTSTLLNNGTV